MYAFWRHTCLLLGHGCSLARDKILFVIKLLACSTWEALSWPVVFVQAYRAAQEEVDPCWTWFCDRLRGNTASAWCTRSFLISLLVFACFASCKFLDLLVFWPPQGPTRRDYSSSVVSWILLLCTEMSQLKSVTFQLRQSQSQNLRNWISSSTIATLLCTGFLAWACFGTKNTLKTVMPKKKVISRRKLKIVYQVYHWTAVK